MGKQWAPQGGIINTWRSFHTVPDTHRLSSFLVRKGLSLEPDGQSLSAGYVTVMWSWAVHFRFPELSMFCHLSEATIYLFPPQWLESVPWYSAKLNSGVLKQCLLTEIYLASPGNFKLHTVGVMIPQTQDDSIITEYKRCRRSMLSPRYCTQGRVSAWLAMAVPKMHWSLASRWNQCPPSHPPRGVSDSHSCWEPGCTRDFLLVSPRYLQCRKFPNAEIKLKIEEFRNGLAWEEALWLLVFYHNTYFSE